MRIAGLALAMGLQAFGPVNGFAEQRSAGGDEERPRVELSLYGWGSSVTGHVSTVPGAPNQDVDDSFLDILENFDFGAMARGTARWRNWSVYGDMVYSDLSEHGASDDPGWSSYKFNTQTFIGTALGGYQILDGKGWSLDVLGGLRLMYVDNELDLRPGPNPAARIEDEETWVDPVLGFRGLWTFWRGARAELLFDAGGFGVGSDVTYELFAGVDAPVIESERLRLHVGYRLLGVDYENDGYKYDVFYSGPVLGAVFTL